MRKKIEWESKQTLVDIAKYFQKRYPRKMIDACCEKGLDSNTYDKIVKNGNIKKVRKEKFESICESLEEYEENHGKEKYKQYY